jgi:hypothetical protein
MQPIIAESVEVWSSRAEDQNEKKYKSLGVVEFKDKIDRRSPDPKPLFVDSLAKWLWFQVSPPKPHESNNKKQVGIDEIQVFGYFDKPPSPPPPEDPKDRRRLVIWESIILRLKGSQVKIQVRLIISI